MRSLTGQKDPIIKLLRDLGSEDGRRRAGRFFADGEELVKRAFDYGGSVHNLVLTDAFALSPEAIELADRAGSRGIDICSCTSGLLAKVLQAKPTPECIAIVERSVASLTEILAAQCPLVQMVENGDNADNLGMLLRSTDAAGADGVVLSGDTADPFSRRVVRGSRGAVFSVSICIRRESAKAIEEARSSGLQVIATSANTNTPYTDIDYTKPTMIIVGSEHTGISDTVRELSDAVVRIPMLGRIKSLNIAVAASIVLYEAVRQRS